MKYLIYLFIICATINLKGQSLIINQSNEKINFRKDLNADEFVKSLLIGELKKTVLLSKTNQITLERFENASELVVNKLPNSFYDFGASVVTQYFNESEKSFNNNCLIKTFCIVFKGEIDVLFQIKFEFESDTGFYIRDFEFMDPFIKFDQKKILEKYSKSIKALKNAPAPPKNK